MYEYFGSFKIAAPNQGSLLISEPYLPDPAFFRSIVLLCAYDSDGAVGYVLNKRASFLLNEVIEDAPDLAIPVYQGGPVQPKTLHFLHCSPLLIEDSAQIAQGIYWGQDSEQLIDLLQQGLVEPYQVRLFAGYSGWIAGQLETELEEYAWIVHNHLQRKHVFGEEAFSWRDLLKEMGGREAWLADFPIDPMLN